jgi:hypothetical protein
MMKDATKRVLLALLCVLAAVAVYYGYHVYRAFRFFAVEDTITHYCHEIGGAIDAYQQVHGEPPQYLSDLVPEQLPRLPELADVERLDYARRDGSWRISVFSNAMGQPRLYLLRSDRDAAEPVGGTPLGQIHGVEVYLLD